MPQWQQFVGSTVAERFAAKEDWQSAAQRIDPEFKLIGIYTFQPGLLTFPYSNPEENRLVIDFESDHVLAEICEL